MCYFHVFFLVCISTTCNERVKWHLINQFSIMCQLIMCVRSEVIKFSIICGYFTTSFTGTFGNIIQLTQIDFCTNLKPPTRLSFQRLIFSLRHYSVSLLRCFLLVMNFSFYGPCLDFWLHMMYEILTHKHGAKRKPSVK